MFAAIYLPKFHLQAMLRHEPDLRGQPVALVDDSQPAKIFQYSALASKQGVRAGMTSTQGLARCPKLVFRSPQPAPLAVAGDILRQCACALSPNVEATGDGICTIDLKTNPQKNYAGWGEKLIAQLAQMHLKARIGVAKNPDLALLAAKRTRTFLQVDDSKEFLRELPIEALDPPREMRTILKKCGIRTVGALTALPKQELPARFGVKSIALWERAAGEAMRLLQRITPPETYEEAMEFEHEIETVEPLLFLLRRFLDQISLRLEPSYLVVRELSLHLGFAAGENYRRTFTIPAPTRDVEILFRILHTHLENFRSDSPITALRLSAEPCQPKNHQFGLFETSLRDPNKFYETLGQLSAVLGSGKLGIPFKLETYRPDSFQLRPSDFREALACEPTEIHGPVLRRFRPARPIQMFSVDNQPTHMVLASRDDALEETAGPWCSSGDWWDKETWTRTEWDVQTAHGNYRISRQHGQWHLDGVYD